MKEKHDSILQDASEMYFRVKYRTAMRKVKKSYADHKNISVDSLRFLFDGRRICDEDTPESLEMTDEDVIEVFVLNLTSSELICRKA